MTFAAIPFRNIGRYRTRSVLTVAGISVAFASLVALVGFSRGVEHAWTSGLRERDTHLIATRRGAVEILAASLDRGLGKQLRQIEGVSDVAGELVDLVETETGEMSTLSGWEPDSYLWRSLRLVRGGLPSADGVLLGTAMADAMRKNVGDFVVLGGRRFLVAGLCGQESVLTDRSIVMLLEPMQSLMGKPGAVTIFNIRARQPGDDAALSQLRQRLAAAFPEVAFGEARNAAEDDHVLRLLRGIAWATSTIAVLMGAVMVLNTLLMSVMERTREMGVLAAIGWPRRRILAMVVAEGLILALCGAGAGSLLGVLSLHWLRRHPQLGGFVRPEFSLELQGRVLLAAVLLGLAGSLYPAWRAARMRPVEALAKQ